jgi:hypothetical protein
MFGTATCVHVCMRYMAGAEEETRQGYDAHCYDTGSS